MLNGAFNQLGQYASSLGNRAYCYAEPSRFSLTVAVTIANTHHCTHQWQIVRLSFSVWLVTYGTKLSRTEPVTGTYLTPNQN